MSMLSKGKHAPGTKLLNDGDEDTMCAAPSFSGSSSMQPENHLFSFLTNALKALRFINNTSDLVGHDMKCPGLYCGRWDINGSLGDCMVSKFTLTRK